MKSSRSDIKYLFEPRSVAIIGASRNEDKLGYAFVKNILASKYGGKIYPVNPAGGDILGIPVYQSLDEVNGDIDLCIVVIPASHTFEAVKDCARKGVKFAALIASGFSEVGNLEEERKIASYAAEHGLRILGPNIFGVYSSTASINATFGPQDISPGEVAIITQSGALGIAMIGKTRVENIGLSSIISVGNKADIDEVELLEYLMTDRGTKVIMMYIEGVTSGERFVETLKEATKVKPVVVLKAGRSKRGAMAAASHTGSLAGEDRVFDDIARQCGVVRAESLQEALNWCKFLASAPRPKGENTVIITNGGGVGVMSADACEKYGVKLYDDTPTLKEAFSGLVPEFGSVKNPIDLTGQADVGAYAQALEAALATNSIHSIICLSCDTAIFDAGKFCAETRRMFAQHKFVKPAVFSLIGGAEIEECLASLKSDGVPAFSDVYEAVSCMGAVYYDYRNKMQPEGSTENIELDTTAVQEVISKARRDNRRFLFSHEAQKLMDVIGVAIPRSRIAHSIDEALTYAGECGFPVVMKVVSRDIIHKSDAGGVALGLNNNDEVVNAYEAILHNCRQYNPGAVIEGIEVAEMVRHGTETIVGAMRDRAFGPIVMFGLGGIYVEIMKDISFRAFPLDYREARRMISEVKSYPLLLGVRGEKRKDIDALADAIVKVGSILRKVEDISDIEINPLVAYEYGEGVKAVDVRVLLAGPREAA